MDSSVDPNVLLENTVILIHGMIKAIEKINPKMVVKLKSISKDARQVQKRKDTFGKVSSRGYKFAENKKFNQRVIKTIYGSISKQTQKHKQKGGNLYALDRYFTYDIDYTYPHYPYYKYTPRKEPLSQLASVAHTVVQATIMISFLLDTHKILKHWFTKNKTLAFIEDSVRETPTSARKFFNICLLSGLSKKSDVTLKLQVMDTQPHVIKSEIAELLLTNDDLENVLMIQEILLSAFAHFAYPDVLTVRDFDNIVFSFFNATESTEDDVEIGLNAFNIKSKFEASIELNHTVVRYGDNVNKQTYLWILSSVHGALDRVSMITETMSKQEHDKFTFMYGFITDCKLCLIRSKHI